MGKEVNVKGDTAAVGTKKDQKSKASLESFKNLRQQVQNKLKEFRIPQNQEKSTEIQGYQQQLNARQKIEQNFQQNKLQQVTFNNRQNNLQISHGNQQNFGQKQNNQKIATEAPLKLLPDATESDIFEYSQNIYQIKAQQALDRYKINRSDSNWMKKIMNQGTMKDRISSLSIFIRDNPLYTIQTIDNLIESSLNHNKKLSMLAIDSLKNLFIEVLLPRETLLSFENGLKQAQIEAKDGKEITEQQYSELYRNHKLKACFHRYIRIIEQKINDPLYYIKKGLIDNLCDLVKLQQENRETILEILVNKFGDTDKKILTHLNKSLGLILTIKPALIHPAIKELERFIFRPNLKLDSQFYAINFINALNFAKTEQHTILEIINFLFILFKQLIEQNDEDLLESKLLSHILRGINKLFPFTKQDPQFYVKFYTEKIDDLYRLIHLTTNFKIKIQVILFLFQVEQSSNSLSDRFYRNLYELLLQPELTSTTLGQIFFDILFLSIKEDTDINRVKSFVKRMLQTAVHTDPPFIITTLILISKIFKVQPSCRSMLKQKESFFAKTLAEEEQKFEDAPDSDDEILDPKKMKEERKKNLSNQQKEEDKQKSTNQKDQAQKPVDDTLYPYNPHIREPKFSKSEFTALWQINMLFKHHHPTVRKFAETLVSKDYSIDYKGNPLLDFSIANFLDRFSFKKAQKRDTAGFQNLQLKGQLRMSKIQDELTVQQLLKQNKDEVREEEKFFLKYFSHKMKNLDMKTFQKNKQQLKKREKDGDDGPDPDDQDFANEQNDPADEADEDEFADELFENELQKNDIANGDIDQEDDIQYSDDGIDYDDGDEDENENGLDQDDDFNDFEQFDGLGGDADEDEEGDEGEFNDEDLDSDMRKELEQYEKADKKKKNGQSQPTKRQKGEIDFDNQRHFDDLMDGEDLQDDDEQDDAEEDLALLLQKSGFDQNDQAQKFRNNKLKNKKNSFKLQMKPKQGGNPQNKSKKIKKMTQQR